MDAGNHHAHERLHTGAYLRLAAMLILSFIAMYVLMYAMVDKFEDVYPNHNQAFMAALMTAPEQSCRTPNYGSFARKSLPASGPRSTRCGQSSNG